MGGVQRYPWPKWMGTRYNLLVVPGYTKNLPHLWIPMVVLGLVLYRHSYLTTHTSTRFNEYLDPATPEAPRLMKIPGIDQPTKKQ